MEQEESWADRTIREMELAANGGFDPEVAAQAVNAALDGLRAQALMVKKASEDLMASGEPVDIEKLSKAMNHMMKTIDGITRLAAFASGKPDSRVGTDNSWLAMLPDDKVAIIHGWIREHSVK